MRWPSDGLDTQGNLSLPLVGPVKVAGLSMSAAREAISAAYARYIVEPKIDLSVIEYAARRFYLFGEVRDPGAYVLDRPLNIFQGLTLAGGFTPKADRAQLVLLRGGPQNLEVHVFDFESTRADGLIALRPDDFLFVRRSGAGHFSDEVMPYLSGIGSSLSSIAALLLIEDQITDN